MNKNNNTYKNVIITSIIATILITSGIGVAYANDNAEEHNHPSTTASGHNSSAFGWETTATGVHTAAFGHFTTAGGAYSASFGHATIASGTGSAAFGHFTTTSGYGSAGFGFYTVASGTYSVAFGDYTTAQPYSSVVLGRYNEISGNTGSWIATDPLFVIGNGVSAASPNNAVTVLKNGNVGIGVSAPTQPLQVAGIIESISEGFKFPDGTIQSTASAGITVEIDPIFDSSVASDITQTDIDSWNYIQLDTSSGKPPTTDCDNADEIGRMKVDTEFTRLYVCTDDKAKSSGIDWHIAYLR